MSLSDRVRKLEAKGRGTGDGPSVVIECTDDTVEQPRPWRPGDLTMYVRKGDPLPEPAPGCVLIVLPGKERHPEIPDAVP